MSRFWVRLAIAAIGSMAVWFTFMIAAIVIVTSLSRQDAISLVGGIGIFAGLLSVALGLMAIIWLAWYRDHRRRSGR